MRAGFGGSMVGDVLLLHGLDDGEDVFGISLEQGKIVGGDLVADAFVAAVDGVDMVGDGWRFDGF